MINFFIPIFDFAVHLTRYQGATTVVSLLVNFSLFLFSHFVYARSCSDHCFSFNPSLSYSFVSWASPLVSSRLDSSLQPTPPLSLSLFLSLFLAIGPLSTLSSFFSLEDIRNLAYIPLHVFLGLSPIELL